jgi:hypothetical protein
LASKAELVEGTFHFRAGPRPICAWDSDLIGGLRNLPGRFHPFSPHRAFLKNARLSTGYGGVRKNARLSAMGEKVRMRGGQLGLRTRLTNSYRHRSLNYLNYLNYLDKIRNTNYTY